MLQTPARSTHYGDGASILHAQSTVYWPPVALTDRRILEDYSPAQMVVDLQAGSIDGYSWGTLELWARSKVGFTGTTDLEIVDTQAKFSAFGKTGPQLILIPTSR